MRLRSSCTLAVALAFAVAMPALMSSCREPEGATPTQHKAQVAPLNSGHEQLASYVPARTYKVLPNCNLETVNGENFGRLPYAMKSDQAATFKGWIDASGLAAPTYWLRFDDQKSGHHLQMSIRLTKDRSDVAALFPGASRLTGFEAGPAASALGPGQYHVYIAVQSDGAAYLCDNGRHVNVSE